MENNTTTGQSTLSDVASKAPQTPLLSAFERSANLHSELHGALDALEQRLADLLTPVPENQQGQEATERKPASQVTNLIEIINDQTLHAIHRISSLLDKLEV